MKRSTTLLPQSKQRLHKSQFLQKPSCPKPYRDQARLSSLVNKQVTCKAVLFSLDGDIICICFSWISKTFVNSSYYLRFLRGINPFSSCVRGCACQYLEARVCKKGECPGAWRPGPWGGWGKVHTCPLAHPRRRTPALQSPPSSLPGVMPPSRAAPPLYSDRKGPLGSSITWYGGPCEGLIEVDSEAWAKGWAKVESEVEAEVQEDIMDVVLEARKKEEKMKNRRTSMIHKKKKEHNISKVDTAAAGDLTKWWKSNYGSSKVVIISQASLISFFNPNPNPSSTTNHSSTTNPPSTTNPSSTTTNPSAHNPEVMSKNLLQTSRMDKASQRWGYKFVSLKGGSPSPSSPSPQCSSETQSREDQQKQLRILKEKLSAAEFQNDHLKKKIDNLTSAYTAIRTHLMLMENSVDEQRDAVASLQVKVIVVIKLNHTAHYAGNILFFCLQTDKKQITFTESALEQIQSKSCNVCLPVGVLCCVVLCFTQ